MVRRQHLETDLQSFEVHLFRRSQLALVPKSKPHVVEGRSHFGMLIPQHHSPHRQCLATGFFGIWKVIEFAEYGPDIREGIGDRIVGGAKGVLAEILFSSVASIP